jgi:very-short-patch-repair endonuclease
VIDLESLKQGFVFICSKTTQDECLARMLFGSTLEYEDKVLKVREGDLGFLYNIDTDVLFGVFEAISDGSLDIEPRAWKGRFPAQVKVGWMEECEPIKGARSLFRKLRIGFGNLLLMSQQVNNLRNAFERVPAIEEDFRKKYPRKYRAHDGHYVRTKSEAIIDNWLYSHLIVHAYERKVPIEEDMYCDFFIPQGKCYIEYWGLQDEEYLKRKKKKRELYLKHGLNLIELTETDIENIDDVLPKKLMKFLPTTFKIT